MNEITLYDRNKGIRIYESSRGLDRDGRLVTHSRYYEEHSGTGVGTTPRERLLESVKASERKEKLDNLSFLIIMNTVSVAAIAFALIVQSLMSR